MIPISLHPLLSLSPLSLLPALLYKSSLTHSTQDTVDPYKLHLPTFHDDFPNG